MNWGSHLNVDELRALEHAAAEEENASPFLEKLGDMMLAEVTVTDLVTLLELNVYTHPNRMRIKSLYEQYVGPTDWTPERLPS